MSTALTTVRSIMNALVLIIFHRRKIYLTLSVNMNGDNLSHHDPDDNVIIFSGCYTNEHGKVKHDIMPLWHKATENDLIMYKDNLDNQPEFIKIADEMLK